MSAAVPSSATDLISDRAYAELRERIVTLRLAPGTVLREDELMSDLAIGRTPLREAIKRLALENLVAVQPRSATYVTAVEAADIVHISEVRAELAARRLDGAARERLEALLEHIRASQRDGGTDALMGLDQAIHRLVWEAARNPYLAETLERYFMLSLRIWYLVLDRVPALGASVLDHARMLEAILAGDGVLARALMRDHVVEFEREIVGAFGG